MACPCRACCLIKRLILGDVFIAESLCIVNASQTLTRPTGDVVFIVSMDVLNIPVLVTGMTIVV